MFLIDCLTAFVLGFVPNFLFAFGTGHALKSKSSWPIWCFIIGGFIAYAIGIFYSRKS
jgi:H+/Cl- antiporter ClcA